MYGPILENDINSVQSGLSVSVANEDDLFCPAGPGTVESAPTGPGTIESAPGGPIIDSPRGTWGPRTVESAPGGPCGPAIDIGLFRNSF